MEKFKRDKVIQPYFQVRQETSVADGLVFRGERIALPEVLQRKIVKLSHKLGHLGKTKTKQMLREKYWLPNMNNMIDTVVDQCFNCQVATKSHKEEPIKTTHIPRKPWETVSGDCGPYLDNTT